MDWLWAWTLDPLRLESAPAQLSAAPYSVPSLTCAMSPEPHQAHWVHMGMKGVHVPRGAQTDTQAPNLKARAELWSGPGSPGRRQHTERDALEPRLSQGRSWACGSEGMKGKPGRALQRDQVLEAQCTTQGVWRIH